MTVFRSMIELLEGATHHRRVLFKKFSQISLKKSAKITFFSATNQIHLFVFRGLCL